VSACLSIKTQALLKEYFIEITKIKSARYGLLTIAVVRRFEAFLEPKTLYEAVEDDARKFIEKRPKGRLKQSGDFIRHMKVFYNWLAEKNSYLVNPFENLDAPKIKRLCACCRREKNFSHNGAICGRCYSKNQSMNKLIEIAHWEKESDKLCAYNRDIFKLYLKYISRYHLDSVLFKETTIFFNYLQDKTDLPIIRSWSTALELSANLKKFNPEKNSFIKGCPIIKVANVLEELGILPIREEAYGFKINERIEKLHEDLVQPVHRYVDLFRKTKRSEKTINLVVQGITDYNDWLRLNCAAGVWTASEETLRNYLSTYEPDTSFAYQLLNGFYKWAKTERYTLSNPLEKIPKIIKKHHLKVCSSEQIVRLQKFIKSPKSDPEFAMILALVFYWGVKCKELALATVEFENHILTIIYHRGTLSYGSRKYRRDQTLQLPADPPLLRLLQKRFEESWQTKFKNACHDLPRQPLILHPKKRHTRAMHSLSIRKIYYSAVINATNVRIPLNVVRRSGADVYSKQNATAILERMGWSKASAFNFIWKPRELFTLK